MLLNLKVVSNSVTKPAGGNGGNSRTATAVLVKAKASRSSAALGRRPPQDAEGGAALRQQERETIANADDQTSTTMVAAVNIAALRWRGQKNNALSCSRQRRRLCLQHPQRRGLRGGVGHLQVEHGGREPELRRRRLLLQVPWPLSRTERRGGLH